MRSIINKYREWQAKSDEKLLAKWPKERELGMTSYILKNAIIFSVAVSLLILMYEAIFIKMPDFKDIFTQLIIMFAVGAYIGYDNWSSVESKYQTKNGKFSSTMKTS